MKIHRECSFKCFLWKADATRRIKKSITIGTAIYVISMLMIHYASYCYVPNVDERVLTFCQTCEESNCYEEIKALLPADQKEKCKRELQTNEEKKRVLELIEKENIPSFRRILPKSQANLLYVLMTLLYVFFLPYVHHVEQKAREGHLY